MRIIENIGFLCGFALTFGLASGSFLAYAIDPHTIITYYYDTTELWINTNTIIYNILSYKTYSIYNYIYIFIYLKLNYI